MTVVPGSVPPGGASFPDSFRLRCALTRPGCTCSPPPEASPPSTVPVGDSVTDCRGMGGFWWDLRGWREQRATFIPPPQMGYWSQTGGTDGASSCFQAGVIPELELQLSAQPQTKLLSEAPHHHPPSTTPPGPPSTPTSSSQSPVENDRNLKAE